MSKKRNGISLIMLIITIAIMIILASVIILSFSNNNPIKEASKLAFMADLNSFSNELNTYNSNQIMHGPRGYSPVKLQADENSVTYNGIEDINKTINNIIPLLVDMPKYYGLFKVVNGKLIFAGTDINQQEWAKEMGLVVASNGEP